VAHGSGLDLACAAEDDPQLRLYRGLRDGLARLGGESLTQDYLFCPLPPVSYHVTAWDGINDANVAGIDPGQRGSFQELLAGLPDSLQRSGVLERVIASPLVQTTDWGLALRFDRLANWGDVSLVAELVPADKAAEAALQRVIEARSRLNAEFQQAFGIAPSRPHYTPHVSVGYFANRDRAREVGPHLGEWNRIIAERVRGLTLAFRRVRVYGFTDMATFFRAGKIPVLSEKG
jgi:hypothetical protein